MCFNTFIAIVAIKHPERMNYWPTVKASKEFDSLPWLEHDSRFRKEAAVDKSKSWTAIDASAWTLCFAKPKPVPGATPLYKSVTPFHLYKSFPFVETTTITNTS